MKKYRIVHSNDDVRKLWTLAHNGVFDKRTVQKIFENNEDGYIVFNSKMIYEQYEKFKWSTSALYKN